MKVYYLSVSTFADNQISLLHHLAEHVDLTYGVIIPCKRANYTESELSEYSAKHKLKFEAFPLKYRFRDPRVILTYLRVVRAIRKAKPDIVYFTNYDQVYINLLLRLLGNIKVIIGFHDVENHSNTRFDYLTNIGKDVLFKSFNHFLTYSESQAEIARKRFPQKKVYTIPLPLIGFNEKPEQDKANELTQFLFFGNILPYKGLDILLKAINRISKTHTNFRVIIAGRADDWEGKYAHLVENKDLLIKEIRFIGNNEISEFYAKADYVVLPYRDTTQSGPLMISYYYNVPVIASNAIGFLEFVKPGVSGFLFDLNKENDLDRVLIEAIERPRSDYNKLKEDQKDFVDKNFSIDSIVRRYVDMLQDVYAEVTSGKETIKQRLPEANRRLVSKSR
jgi:glycosyltransferase involved in cell wall biosynthesis